MSCISKKVMLRIHSSSRSETTLAYTSIRSIVLYKLTNISTNKYYMARLVTYIRVVGGSRKWLLIKCYGEACTYVRYQPCHVLSVTTDEDLRWSQNVWLILTVPSVRTPG